MTKLYPPRTCPKCDHPFDLIPDRHGTVFYGHLNYKVIKCTHTESIEPEDIKKRERLEEEGMFSEQSKGPLDLPKRKIKEFKNRKYDDTERSLIFVCLIEADNDPKQAAERYAEIAEDKGLVLKPVTADKVRSFRKRNIDAYYKELASDVAMTAMIKIAKKAQNDQTQFLASKYITDRAEGTPVARQEIKGDVTLWGQMEQEAQAEELEHGHKMPDGVWEDPPLDNDGDV